jgi:hypothetical protein
MGTGPALIPCSRKAPDSHSSPATPILPGNAARRNTDNFLRCRGICCTREICHRRLRDDRANQSEWIPLKHGQEGAADSRRQPLFARTQSGGIISKENCSQTFRRPHAVLLKERKESRISMARADTASGAPLSVT